MNIDFAPTLVRELRGERDYKSISKELGISYGQFFKLENGYSKLKFEEFIKICQIAPHINLKKIFLDTLCLDLFEFTQDEFLQRYCEVWGEPSAFVLKDRIGFTPSKWWRIKSGKTRLGFEDFIRLISSCGCSSHDFLLHFLPESTLLNYTKKHSDFYENELSIIKMFPEAAQITTIIGDFAYVSTEADNKTEVLRELSKLPRDKFNYLLKTLVNNNVLYLNPESGFYEKHQMKVFLKQDKKDTYETFKALSKYIMSKQSRLLDDEHDQNRIKFNFGVTTVTPEAFEQIKDEMIKCFHSINNIIEDDNLKDSPQMELAMFQMGAFFVDEEFSNSETPN